MAILNEVIKVLKPSPTLAAQAKAKQLQAEGKKIISLNVGEPDFDTPEHVKKAAVEAIGKGFTKYTAVDGIPGLKEQIIAKLKKDQKTDYTTKELIVTNGGKHALFAAFAVLLNPGDEVIIPAPYWTSYPDLVSLAGGIPVIVDTKAENGFLASVEEIKSKVTTKTKAIIINSPSNPTGACYNDAQLKELGLYFLEVSKKQDFIVISDEVYEYNTFDGFHQDSIVTVVPELKSKTIIINSFSKSYAMTGWRVGFAASTEEIIKAMSNHQSQATSNVCSIAQAAAVAAYQDGGEYPKIMTKQFEKRLNLVCDAAQGMKNAKLARRPEGAFYGFFLIDDLIGKRNGSLEIKNGDDFANYLLEKYLVSVVAGSAFGYDNAFRISYALAEDKLLEGLEKIKLALNDFN